MLRVVLVFALLLVDNARSRVNFPRGRMHVCGLIYRLTTTIGTFTGSLTNKTCSLLF